MLMQNKLELLASWTRKHKKWK